ncbi:Calcium-binding EF-hand [Cynara cardunculus var. scolymus]|uniref:Calcium-binding EF-hand n=1 Tax=Cynara cardunculus var. scolymus TaxID=59895 RepID=A0A103YCW5_CYNCS|nr:Calcium-binding EF-hand [Cynara cardunculus var. scolymus]
MPQADQTLVQPEQEKPELVLKEPAPQSLEETQLESVFTSLGGKRSALKLLTTYASSPSESSSSSSSDCFMEISSPRGVDKDEKNKKFSDDTKSDDEDNTAHGHEFTTPMTNPTKFKPETHCSSELGLIIGSLGHQPMGEEIKNMIKEVDADGDGFIDLKEFIKLNTKDIDFVEVLENVKDEFSVFGADKNGLIMAEEEMNQD